MVIPPVFKVLAVGPLPGLPHLILPEAPGAFNLLLLLLMGGGLALLIPLAHFYKYPT